MNPTKEFVTIYGDKEVRDERQRVLRDSKFKYLSLDERKTYAELLPLLPDDSTYTAYDRIDAVVAFISTGSVFTVAQVCNIPEGTIITWARTGWWREALGVLQSVLQMELDARMTNIVSKAIEQLGDRLENGDEVLGRDGEHVRVKIKARELASITSTLFDKRALIRGDPTSVVAKRETNAKDFLATLAEQFAKIAGDHYKKSHKKQDSIGSSAVDAEFIEVVDKG